MKRKYELLNKNQKLEVKKKYYNTKKGKIFKNNIIMSIICSSTCIAFGLYIIISNYLNKNTTIEYIYGCVVSITGIILLGLAKKALITKLSLYVNKNK